MKLQSNLEFYLIKLLSKVFIRLMEKTLTELLISRFVKGFQPCWAEDCMIKKPLNNKI